MDYNFPFSINEHSRSEVTEISRRGAFPLANEQCTLAWSDPWLRAGSKGRRVPCAKTVPESEVFMPLGLALSEKQIPQITENTEKSK